MSSDRDKTSHWNELASQIGVEVPAEPTPSASDATNTETPPATPPPQMPAERQAAKRDSKPRADWKDLAGELGVEVDWTEYSSTPVSYAMPVDTSDKDKTGDPPVQSPESISDHAALSSADEPVPATQSEPEPSKQPSSSDISSFTFSDVPTVDEMNEVLEQANVHNIRTPSQESAFDLSVFDEDDVAAPEDDVAAPTDSERGPESTDGNESNTEHRPRRRRRRGRRSRQPAETGDSPESKSQSDSESGREPAVALPERSIGQDSGDNRDSRLARSEGQDKSRPGRRKRRRRGRKSESSERTKDAVAADGGAGSGDIENTKPGFIATEYDLFDAADNAPADTPTTAAPIDDSEDEAHDDSRVTHRKIPSWNEAIGIVVEANLASRRKTDKSRSRGRGRGPRGGQRK